MLKVFDTPEWKCIRSKDYNFNFNKENGHFARWGKVKDDDPEYAPSPELLDIEVSTICHKGCEWCFPAGTKVDGINIEDVKKGDTVQGVDLKTGKTRQQIVEEVYVRDYCGDLVEIELENGEIIWSTPEHIFFTSDLNEINATDLSVGDDLCEQVR